MKIHVYTISDNLKKYVCIGFPHKKLTVNIQGRPLTTLGTRGNTCSNRNIHIKTNCEA